MRNFGVWCAVAVAGTFMGKEFMDWVWWYIWGDDAKPWKNLIDDGAGLLPAPVIEGKARSHQSPDRGRSTRAISSASSRR